MPGILSRLSLLTGDQTQAAIYVVVGIIVIEGVWLAYLTYMMWKKQRAGSQKAPVADKPESPGQEEQ